MTRTMFFLMGLLVSMSTALAGPKYDVRYGNFGGVGWSEGDYGDAVDDLDRAFFRHDVAAGVAWDRYSDSLARAKKQRNTKLARQIWDRWNEDLKSADRRLVAQIDALPPLKVNPNGTDSWHYNKGRFGKMPASETWRRSYAKSARAAASSRSLATIVIHRDAGRRP